MSGKAESGRAGSSSPSGPGRRQRAPTITIDTSAGDESRAASMDHPQSQRGGAPLQSDTTASPDGKESGLRSPTNVSSPTSKATEHNFLSVPQGRSRGNSLDSTEEAHLSTSSGGETYLASATSSTEGDHSLTQAGESTSHGNKAITNDEDALTPDPGTEEDFQVDDNKFAFSPGQLTKLMNPKSLAAFYALGGLEGLEKGLRTDRRSGLSLDETFLNGVVSLDDVRSGTATITASKDPEPAGLRRSDTAGTTGTMGTSRARGKDAFADRVRIYNVNRLPEKKAKNIFQLAWIAYNDKVLILLSIAAVISLALGLYQTFQPHPPGEPRVEWVEGVAIMVAVLIVVVVGAANDFQKERQFIKLNKKKEDRIVKIIRSGKSREVSIYDVLVGDVMHLEPGDLVPVDGVLIASHNLRCDESSATGESDIIKKQGGDEVMKAIEANQDPQKLDPFIISGAKVTEGIGTFMVTAVGVNSSYGKTLMSLREGTEATPLQMKLNVLAEQIAKLGGAAALLLFVVLFIKFLVGLRDSTDLPAQKGQTFLRILIVAITVVVVAVPEGLPLAVTLALAFATTRMLKDNNLVRLLRACETMGNATTVCSDKTGTLTQNKMSVVAGTVGTTSRFGDMKGTSPTTQTSPSKGKIVAPAEAEDVSIKGLVDALAPDVKALIEQSIVVNSTAFEGEQEGVETFIGSKTETALLSFARDYLGMGPVSVERSNANIVQMIPFDSGRKCMAAVVKLPNGSFRMYAKGASEILLGKCKKIVQDPSSGLSEIRMSGTNVEVLEDLIEKYASRSLRTLSLIYRDFEQWPPQGCRKLDDDPTQANFDDVFKDLVFLSIVGIKDPLRDGVSEAVKTCLHAGVFVRMVTGDNLLTARAIAEECGIYTPGGIVMEGPKFRKLSHDERSQLIPRLQVLARSSPGDKRMLVEHLKSLGETVAVTGDGTNDAPALKTADVGFSMGIAGTEVAKEASDIILMDDNFSSIVKAIMWGRAVNDSVRKFLQFQVTVNITAVLLTFISAVARDDESSVLTAVQLLWVNLIMDTFAALALATDPPTPSILDRNPDPKSAPLITITMWKMIIGQAIYQLVVTLILNFGGKKILSYEGDEIHQLDTLVFNTFVWMQIFNQLNSRRLDNKFNIFEGITRNYFFMIINLIMIGGQTMIIFVGGRAFSVTELNGPQWGYSIVLGALSIPIAIIIRLIPDELVARIIPHRWQRRKTPEVVVSDDDQNQWNPLEEIREELAFLKKLRGGRLNTIKFKLQHPREALLPGRLSDSRSRSSSLPGTPIGDYSGSEYEGSAPPTPTAESRARHRARSRSNSAFGPAAAMAGIVAGSIAGWSPIDRSHSEHESLRFSRSSGKLNLEAEEGIEVHPDTKRDDPVVSQPNPDRGAPPSQIEEERPGAVGHQDRPTNK